MGGVSITDAVTAKAGGLKGNSRLANLDWEAQVTLATTTLKTMSDIQAGTSNWKMPFAWAEVFAKFSAAESRMKTHFNKLSRYLKTMDDFKIETSMLSAEEAKKFTGPRDKMSLALRNVGIWSALAKALAECIVSRMLPKHQSSRSPVDMLAVEDGKHESVFAQPQLLRLNAKDPTVHHQKAQALFELESAAWEEQAKSKMVQCIERGKAHWHGLAVPEDRKCEYPWDADAKAFFKPSPTRPVLCIMRQYTPDNRKEIVPLQMQRQAIQMVVGDAVCIVTDPVYAASIFHNIDKALADAHHASLSDFPAYYLTPGDTLIVPLGRLAIMVGVLCVQSGLAIMKRQKNAKEVKEYCAYVTHAPFDQTADSTHPPETQNLALRAYMACMCKIPASIQCLTEVKEWRVAMESGSAVAATAAAAAEEAQPKVGVVSVDEGGDAGMAGTAYI